MEVFMHHITWWHWIIFGVILMIVEMNTGTFFMLTLGLSAIMVGILATIFNLSLQIEILLWLIFSIVAIVVWMRWYKNKTVSNSGQSDYRLETLGTVTSDIHAHRRGKVTFDTPVLGNTQWHATADETIHKGTRVRIVEVNGQLIKVAPLSPTQA